ncbi:MAG: methionine--tRNA ligase [Dehalococcoidales bacterium]
MSERIFIGVAWPYAEGSLHIGNIAGANLPADIFARYHRLKGNEVLMVSGSDQHGTPITLKAEHEGKTPQEIIDYYQREFIECWQKLGIFFDLYTGTHTENHIKVSQEIFLKLLEKGYLFRDTVAQMYCPKCQRFLPDRYVEGTCPLCKTTGARGDQCDACSKPLNATELINPYCRICKTTPVLKNSEHFFLKLSAFQDKLEKWAAKQKQWRPNVYGFTQRYLKEGLRDRAITRDIEWGIPVPVKGFENKRLYVWFEAVIGYLSASKEWAAKSGDDDKWQPFWQEGTKSYYFLAKDNIPFHTLIWPAMIMGYGGLNLPYDVPANEFLTIEGRKISRSRNWAVWVPDYLSRYDPDPLRYILSINMPETNDADFSWREFVRRNNDELVATYGNLVNRVLTFTYKNFDGKVPESGTLDDADKNIISSADACLEKVGESISRCSFKQAIQSAMSLAQQANRYLDEKAPWKKIKEDKQAAATSLYVAINIISRLKTMLVPFLPFSSQKVHEYLGFNGKVETSGWQPQAVPAGQKLKEPKPLFVKLDESIVEEETKRIGT